MSKWSPLRRARDNMRPDRPVSLFPSVVNTLFDEIQLLKREIRQLKKK